MAKCVAFLIVALIAAALGLSAYDLFVLRMAHPDWTPNRFWVEYWPIYLAAGGSWILAYTAFVWYAWLKD